MNLRSVPSLVLAAIGTLALPFSGRAATVITAWEAFQEHVPSDKTHPHATGHPMRLTAPPQPLKRFADGTLLPVSLEVIATGSPDNFGAQAPPDPGTPAALLFGGILDVGNDGTVGVRNSSGSTVRLVFHGLDPNKKYMFRGTSSRGGSGANQYLDRWSVHAIEGARGFTHAHVAGSASQNIFTKAGFPDADLAPNQVALHTGYNREGSLVGWDDIQPAEDGTFSVLNAQYVGPAPFGDPAAGPYGYSLVAIYLAEVAQVLPFTVTAQPADATVAPGGSASFSVAVQPADGITYQWQRAAPGGEFADIEGATGASYTVSAAGVEDDRTRYRVLISAQGPGQTLASREARLNVIGAPVFVPGFLRFDVYRGITGTSLQNLLDSPRYPDSPDATFHIPGFDTLSLFPNGAEDNYGGRITGFVIPPESGDYEFFLRSDDNAELWLSSDDQPANLQWIAQSVCCGPFEEPGAGQATSAPIPLVAGRHHAIQALLKEGTGSDHLQVAWRKAGDLTPAAELRPIPAAHVGTFIPARGRIVITEQPQAAVGAQNGFATFRLAATSTESPLLIQWRRNGVPIPGAVGPELTFGPLSPADDQARFSALVSVPGASLESGEAVLTVITDTTPPGLLAVRATESFQEVLVEFTEAITPATAGQPGNYQLDHGLTVTGVTILGPASVRLQTTPQQEGREYVLTVAGLQDSVGNVVPPGTRLAFTSFTRIRGGLKFEVFRDIGGTPVQNLLDSPKYPDRPDWTGWLTAFDTRTVFADNANNNYGARVSGWLIPETSGEYEFFVRSDDASQLHLSSDETVANLALIAEETGCCGAFEESGAPETSAPVALVAGRRYRIEGLYKEGTGGDYLQVAWRRVGDPTPAAALQPIPGRFFEVIAPPGTLTPPEVRFVGPAPGAVLPSGAPIVLEAEATAAAGKTLVLVEFFRGNLKLGERTQPPYTLQVSALPDEAYLFTARARDSAGIAAVSPALPVSVGERRELVTIVAITPEHLWRYDRSAQDLGTAWRELNYDDSAWPQGAALIADETGPTVEPIRTAVSRFSDGGEYVKTMYFRHAFQWDRPVPPGARLLLRHVIDDGAVFYLNGAEIHRFGIAPGPVDYFTDAASHEQAYEGPFIVPGHLLVSGRNVLAAEVHQNGNNSSDIVFGAELVASLPVETDPGPPPVLSVEVSATGLVIRWTGGGTLESASQITGPWTTVEGASSPHLVTPAGGGGYFRARR